MKRFVLLLCVACTKSPAPVTLPSVVSHVNAPVVAPSRGCSIAMGAPRTLTIPPELEALAPQYFNVNARDDGFNDLIPKTGRYRWYDPSDLDVSVDPPPDVTIIHRSTKSFFVGSSADGSIRIARRLDKASRATPFKLDVLDAVEDAAGRGWLLAGDVSSPHLMTALHVLRIDGALAVTDMSVATLAAKDPWDRRLARTADGHIGAVWVAEATDGISVMVSWLDGSSGFGSPVSIDHVAVPPLAVDLALRSSTNLRVAAEGTDRIAVAWRPLVPKDGEAVDVGSSSTPPLAPTSAEVRIFTAHPRGTTLPRVHTTLALPLMGTSGVGPWPLSGNGMVSTTLAGHAVFIWHEWEGLAPSERRNAVVYATPDDAAPHAVIAGSFRLLPRATAASSLELLLLRSTGSQELVPFTCLETR